MNAQHKHFIKQAPSLTFCLQLVGNRQSVGDRHVNSDTNQKTCVKGAIQIYP